MFDVVIAGGGPAGSAAAILLARGGLHVLLADARASADDFRFGESLVPSARTILGELGVLDRFLADAHLPCYGNLSAWGTSELTEVDFIRSPYGHGWHLDRARFDAMLRDAAAEAGAVVKGGGRVGAIARDGNSWRVAIDDEEVESEWLVDCGGRAQPIARALGIERHYDDRLIAFFARFRGGTNDRDGRTLVESAPDGWFHTALLPHDERVVTFFTDSGAAAMQQARTADGFLELLRTTTHIERVIDHHGHSLVGEVRSTDARGSRLATFHGEGWLAAGDAATSFDPLSAQGILSALYSGLKAAKAILARDLSAYGAALTSVYEQYEINRRRYYSMERRWGGNPFWRSRQA